MYTAAVKLLTEVSPVLTQEHLDKQRELVEEHIRIEAELIKRISELIPSVENEKVRLLLKAILSDEKRRNHNRRGLVGNSLEECSLPRRPG